MTISKIRKRLNTFFYIFNKSLENIYFNTLLSKNFSAPLLYCGLRILTLHGMDLIKKAAIAEDIGLPCKPGRIVRPGAAESQSLSAPSAEADRLCRRKGK